MVSLTASYFIHFVGWSFFSVTSGLAQSNKAVERFPKWHHVVQLLMEDQRARENREYGREGSKTDRYKMTERKTMMALNSRFLRALLGHLWSMATPPTVQFPCWSSLWLDAQLGPHFSNALNDFNFYCPGDVKCPPDRIRPQKQTYFQPCAWIYLMWWHGWHSGPSNTI